MNKIEQMNNMSISMNIIKSPQIIPWIFKPNIDSQYEHAQNSITNEKLRRYNLQKNHKLTEPDADFDLEKCYNIISEYNEYMENAYDFLKSNPIIKSNITITMLIDQNKCENHIYSLYDKAKVLYDKCYNRKHNFIYNMIPFIKPSNYDTKTNELILQLFEMISNIGFLIKSFPDLKENFKKYIMNNKFASEASILMGKAIDNEEKNNITKEQMLTIKDSINDNSILKLL